MMLARIKEHLSAYSPIYVLVCAYFLTVVLANLLYLTPFARDWPALSISNFSWSAFRPLDLEFWALVLMLPIAAGLVAVPVGKAAAPLAETISRGIPEFSRVPYLLLCAALYSYATYELWDLNALQMLVSAGNQIGAIEARFAVLAGLGFVPRMVLQSLLVFLAVYSLVRAMREGGLFWWGFVLWHIVALSSALVLLNMKWPIVLFVLTLGLTVFITAKKYPFVKSGLTLLAGVGVYLLMSAMLLRMVPVDPALPEKMQAIEQAQADQEVEEATEQTMDEDNASPDVLPQRGIDVDAHYAARAMRAGVSSAPHLLVVALNRMAISVPYYFDIFKSDGPICGTYEDRILKRPIPCEPTNAVYTRMFGQDGFEGRGTAPAAPNLTGFALDGWGGAIVCTILTGIVLGLFLALWPSAAASHVYTTAFIMGGYTAYFFSQLPFEGPIIYDHGMLWWTALVLGWTAVYWTVRLFSHWGYDTSARAVQ